MTNQKIADGNPTEASTEIGDCPQFPKNANVAGIGPCGVYNMMLASLYGHHGDWLLSANGKPVGNADIAANLAGLKFWKDLAKHGKDFKFNICDYVKKDWDENTNPNTASPGGFHQPPKRNAPNAPPETQPSPGT